MARKSPARIVRATRGLWERDRLQMRAVDALLSTVEPKRRAHAGHRKSAGRKPRRTSQSLRAGSIDWRGFRSVLCAIDFSEHSRAALRRAAEVARRGRSTLTVVYVNDPLLVAAAAAALHDRRLAQRSASELQDFIDRTISSEQRAGIRIASTVALGNPADEIIRIAARKGSDLIVLGTHGLTGADRLLLGSTTLSVLQEASIPVLAVPRAVEMAATGPSESWPGRLIVAAVELDEVTDREIAVAARLSEWFGSSLLLVHVIADLPQPAWLTADLSEHERMRVSDAQQRLERLAARIPMPAPAEARVLGGTIADEVAGAAARAGAGLIITALRDRRAWFGARRGSISYHVLSHAVTPVLALPPRWPRAVRKRRA